MIGLALAIIIVGIIFGFVIPWVGIVVDSAGARVAPRRSKGFRGRC